jgi:hypothetical protein
MSWGCRPCSWPDILSSAGVLGLLIRTARHTFPRSTRNCLTYGFRECTPPPAVVPWRALILEVEADSGASWLGSFQTPPAKSVCCQFATVRDSIVFLLSLHHPQPESLEWQAIWAPYPPKLLGRFWTTCHQRRSIDWLRFQGNLTRAVLASRTGTSNCTTLSG